MNRFLIGFLGVCLSASFAIEHPYVGHKLLRLEPITDEHVEYLQALERQGSLDFWTEAVGPHQPVDVNVGPTEFDHFISEIKQMSLPFNVTVEDLQEIIDQERSDIEQSNAVRQALARQFGKQASIVGSYVSYAEITKYMETLAEENSQIKVVSLGKTVQGRDMKAVEIAFNPSATRNVWIDCGIHAREWITPASCIWIVDTLVNDYKNNVPNVRELLTYWKVYVAPSLNPDGYEFSRTSGNRLWRKSRNTNTGSTCIGTDLNRNFPYQWYTGGSSNSPCSETFAGRSAGSEIETKNIINFLETKKGTWDFYMSIHSYGQWWFTPYGYTTNLPADYTVQLSIVNAGAKAIEGVNKRKYVTGTVSRVLYVASGSTVDYAHDSLKVKHSYTIELPPSQAQSSMGFVLPPSLAPEVCDETYKGMLVFMAAVKADVQANGSAPSSG